MNETAKFHVFYVWAYGMEPRHEVYDTEEGALAVVAKAKEPGSGYLNFRVIFGDELDIEPFEKVTSYRFVAPTP